jgi:hypothetical protein
VLPAKVFRPVQTTLQAVRHLVTRIRRRSHWQLGRPTQVDPRFELDPVVCDDLAPVSPDCDDLTLTPASDDPLSLGTPADDGLSFGLPSDDTFTPNPG